jgi:hypothetical protein
MVKICWSEMVFCTRSFNNTLPNKLTTSWDFMSNPILFGEIMLGLGLGDLVAMLQNFLVPFWVAFACASTFIRVSNSS